MCVAIAARTRFPSFDELKQCEIANGDGAGIAWTFDGKVCWKKGIEAKDIQEMIDTKQVTLPALIHFRIATAGGKHPELCHPFPINKRASTDLQGSAGKVLIHNGHWTFWNERCLKEAIDKWERVPSGRWSDSRAMAWLTAKLGDSILEFAEGQRVATLDGHGNIDLWGYWPDEKGIWYSNTIWKKETKVETKGFYHGPPKIVRPYTGGRGMNENDLKEIYGEAYSCIA